MFHRGFKHSKTIKALGLRPRAFISFLVFETQMKHSHSFLKYYVKQLLLLEAGTELSAALAAKASEPNSDQMFVKPFALNFSSVMLSVSELQMAETFAFLRRHVAKLLMQVYFSVRGWQLSIRDNWAKNVFWKKWSILGYTDTLKRMQKQLLNHNTSALDAINHYPFWPFGPPALRKLQCF